MKRVIGLLFFTASIIFPGTSFTRNYYVKTNGSDILSGTNWQTAWDTIAYAASMLTAGDTVIVSNGIYYEGNIIPARSGNAESNIVYRALNRQQVVIYSAGNNYCFNFSLNRISFCVINGFVLKKASTAGIDIQAGPGLPCQRNIFKNNLFFSNGYNLFLFNNNVHNNYVVSNEIHMGNIGVLIMASSYSNIIQYNKIHNILGANGFGLSIQMTGRYNAIKNNQFYSNKYGIHTVAGPITNSVIISNKIYYNMNQGCFLNDISYSLCKHNEIYNNNGGILSGNTGVRNEFNNNLIYSNSSYGISLNNNAYHSNAIISNFIHGHTTGIAIFDADGNRVVNNAVYNNTDQMSLSGTAHNNMIINNLIYGSSSGSGINCGGSINTVSNNYVCHLNKAILLNGNQCAVKNNYICSNVSSGVCIDSDAADNNRISFNVICNQSNGIINLKGDGQVINSNTIFNHLNYGIYISGSTNTAIMYNHITNNSKGVCIHNSLLTNSLNFISKNSIGLIITNLMSSSIIKNNIFNNTALNLSVRSSIVKSTNNWWGSTKMPDIIPKISGLTNLSAVIPYRLFGPFDLAAGADTQTPGRVSVIQSDLSNKQVFLKWNRASGADVDHYNIYAAKSTKFSNLARNDALIRTAQTNCFLNLYGTNYIYITASDNNPVFTNESWYSAFVLTTNNSLKQPVIRRLITLSTDQITIEWENLANETSYTLFRGLNNDVTNKFLGFTQNSTNYNNTGLTSGTWYYFWVRAYNADDSSYFSAEASNRTMPRIPQITFITSVSPVQIDLSWNSSSGVTFYCLYRNTIDDVSRALTVYSGTETNYKNTLLDPGTKYYYWVAAFNEGGSAGYSGPASAETVRTFENNLDKLIIGPNPYKPNSGDIKSGAMTGLPGTQGSKFIPLTDISFPPWKRLTATAVMSGAFRTGSAAVSISLL